MRDRELRLFGLKAPCYERAKRRALVLQVANAVKVLDPVLERLHMPEHHARGAADAELRRRAHAVEPFVGRVLVGCDYLSDSVHQNFSPRTGNGMQTGRFESLERIFQRELRDVGDVNDLGRTQRVKDDLRVRGFDLAKDVFVPVDLELGIEPALKKDLDRFFSGIERAGDLDGFADLVENLFFGERVALGVSWDPVERAELAPDPANVGVVQDSANDVGHRSSRDLGLPARIGQRRQIQHVRMLKELERLFGSDPLPGVNLVGDPIDGGSGFRGKGGHLQLDVT